MGFRDTCIRCVLRSDRKTLLISLQDIHLGILYTCNFGLLTYTHSSSTTLRLRPHSDQLVFRAPPPGGSFTPQVMA